MSETITDRALEAVRGEAERLGLSLRDIGQIIGRTPTSAWRRMKGETPFTLRDLEALQAAGLKLPLAQLLGQATRSRRTAA